MDAIPIGTLRAESVSQLKESMAAVLREQGDIPVLIDRKGGAAPIESVSIVRTSKGVVILLS